MDSVNYVIREFSNSNISLHWAVVGNWVCLLSGCLTSFYPFSFHNLFSQSPEDFYVRANNNSIDSFLVTNSFCSNKSKTKGRVEDTEKSGHRCRRKTRQLSDVNILKNKMKYSAKCKTKVLVGQWVNRDHWLWK
jgi:hypothetical protein